MTGCAEPGELGSGIPWGRSPGRLSRRDATRGCDRVCLAPPEGLGLPGTPPPHPHLVPAPRRLLPCFPGFLWAPALALPFPRPAMTSVALSGSGWLGSSYSLWRTRSWQNVERSWSLLPPWRWYSLVIVETCRWHLSFQVFPGGLPGGSVPSVCT